MATMPYLHFRGDCATALAFYTEVFGGTNLQMMRYAQAPDAPAGWVSSDLVMHGQVTIGDGTLMASDYPPGTAGDAQAAVSIMQSAPDAATAQRWFTLLARDGAVIQPFGPTFFSAGFGMVKDRYGTTWIVAAGPAA